MWYIIWIVSSSPTDFHSEKIGLIRVTYDPSVDIRVNKYLKWLILKCDTLFELSVQASLANLLQIALPITGQWVTDYESINPISGRGAGFHSDFGCLEGGVVNTPLPPNVYFRPRH